MATADNVEREAVLVQDGQTLRQQLPLMSPARFSAYVATSVRGPVTFIAEAGSGDGLRRAEIAAGAGDGWQPIWLEIDPVAGPTELRLSVSGGAGTWGNPLVRNDAPGPRAVVSSVARERLGAPPAPGAIVIVAVSGLDRGRLRQIDAVADAIHKARFERAYSVSPALDETFETLVSGARPNPSQQHDADGLVAAARAAGYATLAVLQGGGAEGGSAALEGFETRVHRSGPWTETLDELGQQLAAAEPYPVLALARLDLGDTSGRDAAVTAELAGRMQRLDALFGGNTLVCVVGLPRLPQSVSVRGGGLDLPLGIRWSSLEGGRGPLDWPVSVLDLAPTLGDLAGLGLRTSVEGQSLVPLIADPTAPTAWGLERRAVFGRSPRIPGVPDADRLAMVLRDGWKLIRDPALPAGYSLHDVMLDPDDRDDVAARHPRLAARLAAELDAWLIGAPGVEPARVRLPGGAVHVAGVDA